MNLQYKIELKDLSDFQAMLERNLADVEKNEKQLFFDVKSENNI